MPEVTGPLTTTADSDVYPTHDSDLGLGGLREVADHSARNAIPSARRRAGMLVYTQSDGSYWSLLPGPWVGSDADWQAFYIGGGGVYLSPTIFTLVSASSFYQAHAYPYPPAVRLIDSAGYEVETDIEYADALHVSISFPQPFSGRVILS